MDERRSRLLGQHPIADPPVDVDAEIEAVLARIRTRERTAGKAAGGVPLSGIGERSHDKALADGYGADAGGGSATPQHRAMAPGSGAGFDANPANPPAVRKNANVVARGAGNAALRGGGGGGLHGRDGQAGVGRRAPCPRKNLRCRLMDSVGLSRPSKSAKRPCSGCPVDSRVGRALLPARASALILRGSIVLACLIMTARAIGSGF